ncbi:MAG: zf-HC2 domain-containing protein [Gemmatimonadetes bacterium]|nr:zf-HC2 domain-containing protein [Gemmatimonadota bacterium]
MTERSCEWVRDTLPGRVAGRLGAEDEAVVDAHLAACAGCREEAELIARLLEIRPRVPAGLAEHIGMAVLDVGDAGGAAPGAPGARRWALAAAASVAVLASALAWLWVAGGRQGIGTTATWEASARDWPTADGTLAGAPVLEDLPEETLVTLLEEMNE